ncbi:hypothetical protein BDV93DRAFT_566577 [Ceratobasidium sp. AG-I]|nr:hypothetical protein BDV93DRAFT_566577 [Ceratobasidium sp. AG-I]
MDEFNGLRMRDGQYFRSYLKGDAHVDEAGGVLADMIPRDSVERETWIQQTIQSIENELAWRRECGFKRSSILRPDVKPKPKKDPYEDYNYDSERDSDEDSDIESEEELVYDVEPGHLVEDRTRIAFMEIVPGTDMGWLMPDFEKSIWTYVLDLDERAFTVNGRIHFPMDNMPPGEDGWVKYLSTGTSWDEMYRSHQYDTPGEYTMTLNRWAEPFLRPVEDHVNAGIT